MLGMIEDPVCGMQINIDTAPARTELDGEIYYFCSEGCKEAFERDPARYLFPEGKDGRSSPS